PDDFAPHEGVDDLVLRDAGEMVGGDVAERVARGLDRMHLHRGELGEHLGHLLELRPVELQVLARREVAVSAVVLAADVGQLAQLPRRQQPIRNRDAQHRRVALDVQPVAQSQRAELVLRELSGEKALRLAAELSHALVHQALVDLVVAVHGTANARSAPYAFKDYCVSMLCKRDLSKMKLQQLRYLTEVVRRGLNVSQAADALHTSQPGVSNQIRALEDELDIQGRVRHGQRLVSITEPGTAGVAIAERILSEA